MPLTVVSETLIRWMDVCRGIIQDLAEMLEHQILVTH